MKSLFHGGLLGLITVALVVFLLDFRAHEHGILPVAMPIVSELTDTYLQGWQVIRGLADSVQLASAPAPGAPASPRSGPRPVVQLTWERTAVEARLRERGFGRGRLRQAAPYLDYIEAYRLAALNEMYQSGVPASITLAQGILESNAGRSRLSRKTNNHFGIKARQRPSASTKIRKGHHRAIVDADFAFIAPAVGVMRFHDDVHYDRFEVYNSVSDSYVRHSDLLTNGCSKPRKGCYGWIWRTFPVSEKKVDIRGVATAFRRVSGISAERFFDGETTLPYFAAQAAALKMAGYATAPAYHKHLAYLIETYELWRFDVDLVRSVGTDYAAVLPPAANW